jgi:hypothetical protein
VVSAELRSPEKGSPTLAVFELMVSLMRTWTSLPAATVSVTETGFGGSGAGLLAAAPEAEAALEDDPAAVAFPAFVPEAVPAGVAAFCVEAFGAGGVLLHPENAGIRNSANAAIIMWKECSLSLSQKARTEASGENLDRTTSTLPGFHGLR